MNRGAGSPRAGYLDEPGTGPRGTFSMAPVWCVPRSGDEARQMSRSIYEEITRQIIELLKRGRLPWIRPWEAWPLAPQWTALHRNE